MPITDQCTRRFAGICLAVGAVSILYILHHTGYPHPPYLLWITEYFLRTQDVSGCALLMALVVAALFAPTRPAALRFVEALYRHPWHTAALTFVLLCLGTLLVERTHRLDLDVDVAVVAAGGGEVADEEHVGQVLGPGESPQGVGG